MTKIYFFCGIRRSHVLIALISLLACVGIASKVIFNRHRERARDAALRIVISIGGTYEDGEEVVYVANTNFGRVVIDSCDQNPSLFHSLFYGSRHRVTLLNLSGCHLQPPKIKSIGDIYDCSILSMENSVVSKKELLILLSALPHLEVVDLRGLCIDSEIFEILEKKAALRRVFLSHETADQTALSKFQASSKSCTVSEDCSKNMNER